MRGAPHRCCRQVREGATRTEIRPVLGPTPLAAPCSGRQHVTWRHRRSARSGAPHGFFDPPDSPAARTPAGDPRRGPRNEPSPATDGRHARELRAGARVRGCGPCRRDPAVDGAVLRPARPGGRPARVRAVTRVSDRAAVASGGASAVRCRCRRRRPDTQSHSPDERPGVRTASSIDTTARALRAGAASPPPPRPTCAPVAARARTRRRTARGSRPPRPASRAYRCGL